MADRENGGVELSGECNLAFSRLAESTCSLPVAAAVSASTNEETQPTQQRKRVPRRVLHFSDGVLEEYSTDEEDTVDEAGSQPKQCIDPQSLPLLQRCWYHATVAATKSLAVADYCGEKLAWAFGITSPKYQYVLDEYKRRMAEEEEDQQREEREEREHDAEKQRHGNDSRFSDETAVTVTMETFPGSASAARMPESVAKF